MPDADLFGDQGSASLQNTWKALGGLELPNMARLGLGRISGLEMLGLSAQTAGGYGRMAIASYGKDSTTGHWEMMGLTIKEPLPLFPQGFPQELIESFEKEIGRGVLGNRAASGTEIINQLGEEHLRTGKPIVYTSADSVFQVAAHQQVIPLDELYRICRIARRLCCGKFAVGRVIARPFVGKPGSFTRTPQRKDFSLEPPGRTLLDVLQEEKIPVAGVGKLDDLFAGRGFDRCRHYSGNRQGMEFLREEAAQKSSSGLIFANLIDFDMLWGHRNDVAGYGRGLEEFDRFLPRLQEVCREEDILMIVSDHGNDPTTPSTDHTREFCLLLVWSRRMTGAIDLGTRQTLADIGATAAEYLGVPFPGEGSSFLEGILAGFAN
jgi:phosphopentomutase